VPCGKIGLVPTFGITVTYFAGVQAAEARALARRPIISFAKSSRVKVLSIAKMPSGWNAFEISDIRDIQLSRSNPAIRM
jgi:hypothetical protein